MGYNRIDKTARIALKACFIIFAFYNIIMLTIILIYIVRLAGGQGLRRHHEN